MNQLIMGDEDVRTLLEMVNRGGLAKPTELTITIYVVCQHASWTDHGDVGACLCGFLFGEHSHRHTHTFNQ